MENSVLMDEKGGYQFAVGGGAGGVKGWGEGVLLAALRGFFGGFSVSNTHLGGGGEGGACGTLRCFSWSTVVGEASICFMQGNPTQPSPIQSNPTQRTPTRPKSNESKCILNFWCSMVSIKELWKMSVCFYKSFM